MPMLTDELLKKLDGISDGSVKGYPVKNLYRLMYTPELWMVAYSNLQSNKGAMTKGVNEDTFDGCSKARVDGMIQKLREGTYEPNPVRRTSIPTSNGNSRPLGIPRGTDKLVQEVARIIVERIYEPVFSDFSHGFRPKRSCHTALSVIQNTWNGTKWICDVDITGFFDNIDHNLMVKFLEKRIDDKRFIRFLEQMLKTGYIEDWKFFGTYTGTPQGGVISPILSNVYLNELDKYVERLRHTLNKGEERKRNLEYRRLVNKVYRLRQRIDLMKDDPAFAEEVSTKKRTIAEHMRVMQTMPSMDTHDPNFKRLRYIRYADDFVIGIVGSMKEARGIMKAVRTFTETELNLSINEEKSSIVSMKDGFRFLNYDIDCHSGTKIVNGVIHGQYTKRRTLEEVVRLSVPVDRIRQFCKTHEYGNYNEMKSFHRNRLLALSVPEMISTYNTELRGFTTYYGLDRLVKPRMSKLLYLANHSLYKTIASKLKIASMGQVMSIMKRSNGEYVWVEKGKKRIHEFTVFRTKHIRKISRSSSKNLLDNLDYMPNTAVITAARTELVQRLEAHQCEHCGSTDKCEVHHVKKLKDLQNKRDKSFFDKMMIARSRKTMVLCVKCHHDLHNGTLGLKNA